MKEVSYSIKGVPHKVCLAGDEIEFLEDRAFCDICGERLIILNLADINYCKMDDIYREKHNLISRDEIKNFTLINGVTYEKLALIVGDTKENIELYASFKKRPSKEISDKLRELQNVKLLRERLNRLQEIENE